ncbi:MAG: hypothetical protein ACRDZ3_03480, partial [Acidimicrobiia bacterium]
SWLAEVTYALLDQAFGPVGIRVLRATISALIAYLVYRLAARITGSSTRAALLTLAALAVSFTLWSERPLLFGVLAMVVLVWTVEVPDSLAGRHPLIVLPPLLWIWANVHGSFALGFAYLGLHLAGRFLDGARPWQGRERVLLTGGAVGLAVCCLNPLGLTLLTFPLHLLSRGDTLAHILEWRSPDFHKMIGMFYALWIAIFFVAIARNSPRVSRRDLLVSVPFLLLGLWALRNLALAPLVGLPIVARALAADRPRVDSRLPLNIVVAALLVMLGGSAAVQATGDDDFDLRRYPVEAMEAVEERGLLGQDLFTSDAWAAYLIHEYWPDQHVFIDDRYDMYPVELSAEYFRVSGAEEGWDEILDRRGIDVVVFRVDKPLAQVLDAHPGWVPVHRDKLAAVWSRKGAS